MPDRARPSTATPRMADVAVRAGVSMNTVSLTLRAPHRVAPETRARVQAAMAALDYTPNGIAGALASRRSPVVGIVVPTLITTIYGDFLEGLAEVVRPEGLDLLVVTNDYEAARETELVRRLLAYRPTALVLTGLLHQPALVRQLRDARLPVVEAFNHGAAPIGLGVGFSNYEAMRDITAHVLARGRRRPVYCALPWVVENDRAIDRRRGFFTALGEVAPEPGQLHPRMLATEFGHSGGAAAVRAALALAQRPDALVFGTDVQAIGALVECARLGIRVPDDLAISGFGDQDLAALMPPGLTTVQVDFRGMGMLVGQRLLQQAAEDSPPRQTDIGYRLVVRGST